MIPNTPDPIERFFARIDEIQDWPQGVVPVPQRIAPPAFFPGSDGLWREARTVNVDFPYGGLMVLGHNLDSEAAFVRRLESGQSHGAPGERMATWRNLLRTLERAGISPTQCFFTNAYVGLRAGDCPTGAFAGERHAAFRTWCERFVLEQIAEMKPRAVATLGAPARRFMARLSSDLSAWDVATQREVDVAGAAVVMDVAIADLRTNAVSLVHPSFGGRHVGNRCYRGTNGEEHTGTDAEATMLQDALCAT